MKTKKWHITLAAVAAFATGTAQAGFVLEQQPAPAKPAPTEAPVDAPSPVAQPIPVGAGVAPSAATADAKAAPKAADSARRELRLEARLTDRITQEGRGPAELPAVPGAGKDVPLTAAMRAILPAGWKAFTDGIDEEPRVTWVGGAPWPTVLDGMLATANLRAAINWKRAEVTLTPAKAAVAEEIRYWDITPDKSLRENLRSWAAIDGWTLVWSAARLGRVVDYPVEVSVRIKGELAGQQGAVKQLLDLYTNAEVPLQAEFFQANRVIEVRVAERELPTSAKQAVEAEKALAQ